MADQPKSSSPKDSGSKESGSERSKPESKLSDLASKIPDFSELTKKIDIDGILGGIKSMINPEEGASANVDPQDALGMKVTEISALLQEIGKTHTQLSKDIAKVNDLLSGLFKDVEAIRSEKSEKSS